MRALVTGISGFVGGFLAAHLLDRGDTVLGASADGAWLDTSPEELRHRVVLVPWDLSTDDGLSAPARQMLQAFSPEVIYHLAALSVPEHCGSDEPTAAAWALNVGGTRRVLELARLLQWRSRVVLISSSHVYAPVSPSQPRVDEDAPLGPIRAYGRTKLAAEQQVHRALAEGCDAVIVRAFPHTGPRQQPPMMLPQWVEQFVRGKDPVEVYTLDAQIDVSDVRDVVRAYRLLAVHGQSAMTYNVGSGIARRSGDIFQLLRERIDPKRRVVQTRPGFKQDPIADIRRLVRHTGWQPRIPLEQTIEDTVAWWRSRIT